MSEENTPIKPYINLLNNPDGTLKIETVGKGIAIQNKKPKTIIHGTDRIGTNTLTGPYTIMSQNGCIIITHEE